MNLRSKIKVKRETSLNQSLKLMDLAETFTNSSIKTYPSNPIKQTSMTTQSHP